MSADRALQREQRSIWLSHWIGHLSALLAHWSKGAATADCSKRAVNTLLASQKPFERSADNWRFTLSKRQIHRCTWLTPLISNYPGEISAQLLALDAHLNIMYLDDDDHDHFDDQQGGETKEQPEQRPRRSRRRNAKRQASNLGVLLFRAYSFPEPPKRHEQFLETDY